MNYCRDIICKMFLFLVLFSKAAEGSMEGTRLYDELLKNYEPLVRPVRNESDPIVVKLGIDIQQLINVDEKNQMVQLNIWLRLEWTDAYLRWDPRKHGGITEIRLPSKKVWRPDILLYNSADADFDTTYDANLNVFSSGRLLWLPPTVITCTCKIDIRWFPFDDQRCTMKFGSWTYSGSAIELIEEKVNTGTYIEHGAWELKGVSIERNMFKYDCCPEPYYDITFMLWLRRRPMYYGYNLILPCVLMSFMTILGFMLPPESGEKLTLETTIFMSLCVFLLMVVEMMPPTSDALPLIGIYFFCTILVVSVSVCTSVSAMNFHKRTSATYVMNPLVRGLLLNWLPWLLMMKRPGHRFLTNPWRKPSIWMLPMAAHKSSDAKSSKKPLSQTPSFRTGICILANEAARLRDGDQTLDELVQIYEELQYINEHIQKKQEERLIDEDWKFAAMAVDRLCLVLFLGFLIAATCAILFAPPHLNM